MPRGELRLCNQRSSLEQHSQLCNAASCLQPRIQKCLDVNLSTSTTKQIFTHLTGTNSSREKPSSRCVCSSFSSKTSTLPSANLHLNEGGRRVGRVLIKYEQEEHEARVLQNQCLRSAELKTIVSATQSLDEDKSNNPCIHARVCDLGQDRFD